MRQSKEKTNAKPMPNQSLELLNKVQSLLIEFANQEGISLQDEFASVEDFKKFVIGFTFKILTDKGVSTKDAYDMVAGDGAYDTLAERVWNDAQRPAAKEVAR
jgi:hypothetical protein